MLSSTISYHYQGERLTLNDFFIVVFFYVLFCCCPALSRLVALQQQQQVLWSFALLVHFRSSLLTLAHNVQRLVILSFVYETNYELTNSVAQKHLKTSTI